MKAKRQFECEYEFTDEDLRVLEKAKQLVGNIACGHHPTRYINIFEEEYSLDIDKLDDCFNTLTILTSAVVIYQKGEDSWEK